MDPEQEVVQFIVDHLHTVPHLEALLLIWQNPASRWTNALLAERIYVSWTAAQQVLEDFGRIGIVHKDPALPDAWIFDPAWDRERQLLPRLADLYRRQLVQVTKLIHSKGSSSIREFARAFQIKKDH